MNAISSFFSKYKYSEYLLGLLRIFYGFEFLFAFFDKLLGIYSVDPQFSYLAGSSPTQFYLTNITNPSSPFSFIFSGENSLLVQFLPLVDITYMGMLLIGGITLLTGIGVRLGATSTAIFFFSVWLASFPPANNPLLEAHFLQMWILIFFAVTNSGFWLGLGERWINYLSRFDFLPEKVRFLMQ